MTYKDLLTVKNSMSGMVFSMLPYEKKFKCYGLLDQAELVFTNLSKHRSAEHGIPLSPAGNLDTVKWYNNKKQEFKKELEKNAVEILGIEEIELEAIKQANTYTSEIAAKINGEDYTELLEPISPKYLNFLTEAEFAIITRPRTTPQQMPDGTMEKIEWFLTGDQERVLYKFLVEQEKKS